MKEERRKHKRISDVFIVTYRLKSPFDVALHLRDREYAAVAMDVSEGGLGVEVGQAIPVKTQVQLRFKMVSEIAASELKRQRDFDLAGEARYCELVKEKSYRVGILFQDISAEDRAFITAYIKDQALKKYFQNRV